MASKKQKLPTPLDYVHFLAGLPAPEIEEEPQYLPVPTPVYMPNPHTLDTRQMMPNPMSGPSQPSPQQGPYLPPPVATPPPHGY